VEKKVSELDFHIYCLVLFWKFFDVPVEVYPGKVPQCEELFQEVEIFL
jgi:hypothetical protein